MDSYVHIVALCEASNAHGGSAVHQDLARDNAMLGMVEASLNFSASISAILHGCIFRLAFGGVASCEMVNRNTTMEDGDR